MNNIPLMDIFKSCHDTGNEETYIRGEQRNGYEFIPLKISYIYKYGNEGLLLRAGPSLDKDFLCPKRHSTYSQ